MNDVTVNRKNPRLGKSPIEELTPRPDPPAERSTRRIIMNIFGNRYELTHHTEIRVLPKAPAKVIRMTSRRATGPQL